MPGARGRSGGRRPGAGRPPGSAGGRQRGALNLSTREERSLYEKYAAKLARWFFQHKTLDNFPMPDAPADAAVVFSLRMLMNLAARGDGRCAIHIDERLHGRVKFSLEHGGPDGGPIPLDHGAEPAAFKVVPPRRRPRAR